MSIEKSIQIGIVIFLIGILLCYYGMNTDLQHIVSLGGILIFISFFPLLLFVRKIIKSALIGEHTIIFDVSNHIVRDAKTNQIIFNLDIDGNVFDHQTGKLLCRYDKEQESYIDIYGNRISLSSLCPCPEPLSSDSKPETDIEN